MPRCDIAVVGGGPAGLVAAGLLARRGAAVTVFDRSEASGQRIGETLGAEVAPLLKAAGAWDAVAPLLAEQPPYTVVRSAWGSPEPLVSEAFRRPLGTGWHIDRQCFDAGLAEWAQSCGAVLRRDVGNCSIAAAGDGLAVVPHRGQPCWADRVIDASGRGAPASHALPGWQWVGVDRQVGLLASYAASELADPEPGLLLEAVEHGFWYSAPQPNGKRIAVFVTDADVLQRLGPNALQRLQAGLAASLWTARRLAGRQLLGPPRVFRSDSGWLAAARASGWQAVGDAAMATDPLGGNGIARALQSALDLVKTLDEPCDLAAGQRAFAAYRQLRARYYWLEARWPAAPFWARRRPLDAAGEPLNAAEVVVDLDPSATLALGSAMPAAAQAWLPLPALAVVTGLHRPAPAHRLLADLRAAAPIGDRALIIGVQWLLSVGALRQV